jgi:hypothetical protein
MLQAILAQHTSEVMIELLEINHEALATPLRFCNDAVAVVSNGNRYEPWPFQVKLPTDDPEQEPRASITISNVDLSVTMALDQLPSKPTMTLSVVTLTNPDFAEYGPMTFDVAHQEGDARSLTLQLVLQNLDQEPYPSLSFTPQRFPALF